MNVTAYSADAYGAPSASRSLTDLRAAQQHRDDRCQGLDDG